MTLVDVADVSVTFGDATILEGVSCEVEAGEFVGLVGPNGAGKTTLLRTISGAIDPTDGHVTVGDVPMHEVRSRVASRQVATVPQDTALSFSFPVRDVVAMGRYPHRSRFAPPDPRDEELVASALEQTATDHLAERPIDEVSGGERQRVLLARAIAQDTPALLLDEPTASLDVNHQIETLELVSRCARSGSAVVAAIHDLDLAARYCDRLVLLADGRVVASGPPRAVLTTETIAGAFETDAVVTPNPVTGSESVTALPDRGHAAVPGLVHVLGTGSLAAQVLARLGTTGARVSAGPLAHGSVAAETADRLGLETIETAPLSRPDPTTATALEAALDRASVTVVAGPLGESLESTLETSGHTIAIAGVDPPLEVDKTCRLEGLLDALSGLLQEPPLVHADDD